MEALEALVSDVDYGAPWEEQTPQQRALCTALECAALSRQTDMVITLMGKALPLPLETVERLVRDEGYEPLALALKALGMAREGIERVLIFCHPDRCPAADHMIFLMDAVDRLPYAQARDLFGKMVGGDAMAVSLHSASVSTSMTRSSKASSSKTHTSKTRASKASGRSKAKAALPKKSALAEKSSAPSGSPSRKALGVSRAVKKAKASTQNTSSTEMAAKAVAPETSIKGAAKKSQTQKSKGVTPKKTSVEPK
jgi:hypothetical protein